MDEDVREELLRRFATDRALAHKYLFAHRRKDKTPEFHKDVLDLFYSPSGRVALQAFRGAAKSTLIEEYTLLECLFRRAEFAVIVGNSYGTACERLASIKQELTTNDALIELFGNQQGATWAESEIVLANGRKIQALGARQSMRGIKHNNERPDLGVIDDLEDEEMVATEDAIHKTKRWLYGVLIPALNPHTGRLRMLGTPLNAKCVVEQVMTNPNWETKRFPIRYIDGNGEMQPMWPDRFSLDWIEKTEQAYRESGNSTEFEQEYMCRPESEESKPFKAGMIKVAATPSLWMPTQIMVDPARKGAALGQSNKKLSRTGYAVWSWVGSKLIVHEAFGAFHKPDEIIDTMFKLDAKYKPVDLGVEADGLEEFIMQPLRAEQIKRGIMLPIRKLKAPNNKLAFITSLQPFYNAGEVTHAKDMPDLVGELLAFPSGRNDVPNALAYATKMRGGRVVYEDFNEGHVAQGLEPDRRRPIWLVVSSRPALTACAIVQMLDGALRVYADFIKEAPPMDCLVDIIRSVAMDYGVIKLVAPQEQFDRYNNNGVVAACNRERLRIDQSASAVRAQGTLQKWMQRSVRGDPGFLVDDCARWTLNGLSLGYRRLITSAGLLADQPEDNVYKVLIEAIESFASWGDTLFDDMTGDKDTHYAYTPDGRKYISSLPQR